MIDYLVKNGHEEVVADCISNVFKLKALSSFKAIEDSKDVGINGTFSFYFLTMALQPSSATKNLRIYRKLACYEVNYATK